MDREWLKNSISFLKEKNHKTVQITHFLCTEVSRISRSEDITQTFAMKNLIESTGVEIVTTSNWMNISSKSSNDTFLTDFHIIRAKMESIQTGERSKNWILSKLHNGERTFPVPVGYERIHVKAGNKTVKIIQHIEPQASIVKEGLEMFANGVFQNNTQLQQFFNEKMLESNHYNAKPWKLNLMFIKRMFEIEKLYFYAGFVIKPSHGITKPIDWKHPSLISLATVRKILKRIDAKWELKFWPRKDSNDLYPLRGLISCPYCNYPMTARPSKSATGKIYHYYGCNRKDCRQKENIWIDMMHKDFSELLKSLGPKKWIIKLLDIALKETFKEKNKIISAMIQWKEKRIKDIEAEIETYPTIIGKLSRAETIQRLENKRWKLEVEKEILEEEVLNKTLNEEDFYKTYQKIKWIIEDPLSIWELWTMEMKISLIKVLFGDKIYYTKNEKYQTPHLSHLYAMFGSLDSNQLTSLAPNPEYFEHLISIIKNTPNDKLSIWKPILSGFLETPQRYKL